MLCRYLVIFVLWKQNFRKIIWPSFILYRITCRSQLRDLEPIGSRQFERGDRPKSPRKARKLLTTFSRLWSPVQDSSSQSKLSAKPMKFHLRNWKHPVLEGGRNRKNQDLTGAKLYAVFLSSSLKMRTRLGRRQKDSSKRWTESSGSTFQTWKTLASYTSKSTGTPVCCFIFRCVF